jgi:tripartite-type tricarboxylate transporter receptor subunit TctC
MRSRMVFLSAAWLCGALFALQPAHGQSYPTRTVRIIVPHTAAAPFDGELRAFAQSLTQSLGQAFVLENRDGADGAIGAEACARSAADGYTLCATTSSVISLNPAVYQKLAYDPARDFAPIIQVGVLNSAIVAHPSVPVNSFGELLDLARAKPDSITWGTMGNTSLSTLLIGWLKAKRSILFYAVPYKNATQGMTATLAGEVQVTAYALGQIVPMVKAGKLKALAVAASKRSAFLPEVPTTGEFGVDLSALHNWIGLFAPAGSPREVILRVNAEVAKVMASPGFKEKFQLSRGIEPDEYTGVPPDAFADYLKADREAYAEFVAAIGLKKQ